MTTEEIKDISQIYPINILVFGVDDDETIRMAVEEQMRINGIAIRMFSDGDEFRAHLNLRPHICFIDYNLTPLDGNMLTEIVTKMNPECRVTMITGQPDDYQALWMFHNKCGGKHWLYKGEPHEYKKFLHELVSVIEEDIRYVKTRLELQAELHQLKQEITLRKRIKERREEDVQY
jgi:FixJ family two-component response regulator